MIGVRFDQVEEFLDELDLHADDIYVVIERAIVRATPVYRSRYGIVTVKAVSVVASFVSSRPHSLPELIQVEAVCGQLWGQTDPDERTTERRDAIMEAILAACTRHGLERRAGIYEVRD